VNDNNDKLIRVGRPLIRVIAKMQPCQPIVGPITDGPLIRVGAPIQKVITDFHLVQRAQLRLEFHMDEGTTKPEFLAKLVPILELVKGCGFSWDRANSNAKPGQISIQFQPMTAEAEARLPWLKELLQPILVTTLNVTKPEWSEQLAL